MKTGPAGASGAADVTALRALAWIAEDGERLAAFFAATGADPGSIAAAVEEPAFLRAVLDFVLGDDRLVIGFCDWAGLSYDAPLRARAALPGGGEMHWT
jgi:hypothetical protein